MVIMLQEPFVSGDGSFSVITKVTSLGFGRPTVSISQANTNVALLTESLGVGSVYPANATKAQFVVADLQVLSNLNIPFFSTLGSSLWFFFAFLKWREIISYKLALKRNNILKANTPNELYITNIKAIWEDDTILFKSDLSLEASRFNLKIQNMYCKENHFTFS